MLKIFINGQQKLSQTNNNAKEFQNVQFFSSDNWHTPADAEYRNLCFETEKEENVEGKYDRRVRCMISILFSGCAPGFTYFDHTRKCYQWFQDYPQHLTWSEANEKCKSLGGSLASVHDEETNNFFVSKMSTVTYVGGHKMNGNWVWADGSSWSYSNWYPGKPGSGDILEIFHGWGQPKWNAVKRSWGIRRGFICQI